jgi:hypothetical protein
MNMKFHLKIQYYFREQEAILFCDVYYIAYLENEYK